MLAFEEYILSLLLQIEQLNPSLILLVGLLCVLFIVFDNFDLLARRKRRQFGTTKKAIAVSVDGSKSIPVKNYVSEMQGLAGRPDAIIIEDGYFIPLERKPLARKIRDRHIAQLLVYMRLVEEFEGKKPPYGYLILGKNARKIKIENSDTRQRWLQGIIDEMRGIMDGLPSKPTPYDKKCASCVARQHCKFRMDLKTVDKTR